MQAKNKFVNTCTYVIRSAANFFFVCKRSYVLLSRILTLLAFLKTYLCYQSDNSYSIVSFEKLILNENSSKFEHLNQHKWSEPNTPMIWWRKKEKRKISGSWMKKQVKPNVYYDHQLLWNQIFKRREGKITFV